jgi:hypothetical protein
MAGMGAVARLAVVCNQGFSTRTLTVEHIADHLDQIMDLREARVCNAVAPEL